MTYATKHRAEKQRQASARFRGRSLPRWVRVKAYKIGANTVELKELSERNSGRYGLGQRDDIRLNILMLLGGKCATCEENDLRCLQIDHINGGGYYDRSVNSYKAKALAAVWLGALSGKYQLLCANCNWRKRYDNNEHRKH